MKAYSFNCKLSLAAVGLLAAGAAAQVLDEPISTSTDRPTPRTDGKLLIRRPIRINLDGGLQSLVFSAPFESAEILPAGGGYVATHYQNSRTDLTTQGANVYRGTFHTLDFSGAVGITDLAGPVEAKFELSFARLGAADHEISATHDGRQTVPARWRSGLSLRRAALGLKIGIYDDRALDLTVSMTGWAKLPLEGDENLTDTGEAELGGVVAISHGMRVPATVDAPTLFLHAQIGAMWRKEQSVLGGGVHTNGGAIWGFGAVIVPPGWTAGLVFQAQGAGNAWEDLDDYNSDPAVGAVGARVWFDREEGAERAWYHGMMFEAAAAFGFANRNGPDTALTFGAGYHF